MMVEEEQLQKARATLREAAANVVMVLEGHNLDWKNVSEQDRERLRELGDLLLGDLPNLNMLQYEVTRAEDRLRQRMGGSFRDWGFVRDYGNGQYGLVSEEDVLKSQVVNFRCVPMRIWKEFEDYSAKRIAVIGEFRNYPHPALRAVLGSKP